MNNASRMKIICDPFKKIIECQWYDSNIEDYVPFDSSSSKLAREEFVHTTIQNRAHEIIDEINKECNVGNVGLEISFVGTEDDYGDLCNVINNFFHNAQIKCIRDEQHFYNKAGDVMPEIKKTFAEVKEVLNGYKEEEITKPIDKYNDAVKPSVSLCMIGLYSAGKSAFINSIIGAEVLPSASDPTTARVCEITCGKEYQIHFLFDGKECVLTFEGTTYKPNSNCDKEIIKKLQDIVKPDTRYDEVFHMNQALDIFNDKHKISDIIKIRIPFNRSALPVDEFDFIIYDTPGSNSDNNVRHLEVLKNSLDEQTNALPFFLTTPDTMDAEDNSKLLNLIEETGAALDTTNAIVVVNRADEKGPNALRQKREKCQNLRITKWKSTQIFFLSSVIAIASKKDNPDNKEEWLDEDMFEIYEKDENMFSSDRRKLFEFNIVDKSKTNNIAAYPDSEKRTHLYKNSGLESIEKEIIEYARRYALYNKCQQASVYLQEAIEKCGDRISEEKKNLDAALEEAKKCFDSKKQTLCDDLESRKRVVAAYNTEFQKSMEKDYNEFISRNNLGKSSNDKKKIREVLRKKWRSLKETERKEKKDKGWAISKIDQFVCEMYNGFLKKFSEKMNTHMKSFWDGKSVEFKEDCIKVVHGSDALTEEQKQILEHIVRKTDNMPMNQTDFDLRKIGAIRKKYFLFWELQDEKFDVNLCGEQLIEEFDNVVRKRMTRTEGENNKTFINWTNDLIEILIAEICNFNSDLSAYKQRIDKTTLDIKSKEECKQILDKSRNHIDGLLHRQTTGR